MWIKKIDESVCNWNKPGSERRCHWGSICSLLNFDENSELEIGDKTDCKGTEFVLDLKNYSLFGIYRQHGAKSFVNNFQNLLAHLDLNQQNIIIAGDMNIRDSHHLFQNYQEVLDMFNLTQHVKEATHIAGGCLDHIISNFPMKAHAVAVKASYDHQLTVAFWNPFLENGIP